jgi:hypothetical protein
VKLLEVLFGPWPGGSQHLSVKGLSSEGRAALFSARWRTPRFVAVWGKGSDVDGVTTYHASG